MAAKGNGKRRTTAEKIVPIYARLPRGPHPIGAPGVARNQRIRIHGGMIEAVTTRGYPQASVKLVIGLAGVSRRSFYEQFSGKEDCFTATFDLIVNRALQRLSHAYRTAQGNQRARLRAMLRAWGAELEQNPKALRLVIVDAETAGVAGLRRLQRATAACEGLLRSAFSNRCPPADEVIETTDATRDERERAAGSDETASGTSPNGHHTRTEIAAEGAATPNNGQAGTHSEGERTDALAVPVVRAIVGGLRRATQMRLLEDDIEDLETLVGEMLKWSLLFKAPAAARLRPRPCTNQPFPELLELEPGACGGEDRRARLLRGAIEAGLREQKFENLSSLQIADGAGLPFEAVTELFADPSSCYLEALEVLGDELLQLVASPELVSAHWAAAVCHTVEELLSYLANSPARLMTFTMKALEAGPTAIASVRDLTYEVATLLTEGSPKRARSRIAVEGIAGGVWQILYCEALAGRGHRLPVLAEYVSYVVLTPYIGPDAAIEAIVRTRPQATGARNGVVPTNGSGPVSGMDDESYRRLAERRSARCVNTTPTSTESTITTIKGA